MPRHERPERTCRDSRRAPAPEGPRASSVSPRCHAEAARQQSSGGRAEGPPRQRPHRDAGKNGVLGQFAQGLPGPLRYDRPPGPVRSARAKPSSIVAATWPPYKSGVMTSCPAVRSRSAAAKSTDRSPYTEWKSTTPVTPPPRPARRTPHRAAPPAHQDPRLRPHAPAHDHQAGELCFSHGWQEYPARVSHSIRGRCLHAGSE